MKDFFRELSTAILAGIVIVLVVLSVALWLADRADATEDCKNEAWQTYHQCRIANALEIIAENVILTKKKK